jgi:hypothetical protein
LWPVLSAPTQFDVSWQAGEQLQGAHHWLTHLVQSELIVAASNFNFRVPKAKFFWQLVSPL